MTGGTKVLRRTNCLRHISDRQKGEKVSSKQSTRSMYLLPLPFLKY